jgi:hypothetical protein
MSEEQANENHVETTIKKFNEAVDAAVPMMQEIKDIKRDITKDINACIKFGYDRPAGEFNTAVALIHDFESCMDEEDSKLYKMMLKMQKVVEYYTAFGKGDIIDKMATKVGLDLDLTTSVDYTLGSDQLINRDKTQDAFSNLFGKKFDEVTRLETLENLMNVAVDTRGEIVDRTNEVKEDMSEPIAGTGISKSTFVKAVNLKINIEDRKDGVDDKIHSITADALLQAEALQSLLEED